MTYAPEPPPPRAGLGAGTVLTLAFLLSLIGATAIHLLLEFAQPKDANGAGKASQRVVVPELQGLPVAAAREKIADAGLLLHIAGERPASGLANAHVASQRPLPGSLLRGDDPVQVTLAAGVGAPPAAPVAAAPAPAPVAAAPPAAPATVAVPKVTGVTIAAARQQLEAAGLKLGQVTGQASDQAKDLVLTQALPPGTNVAGASAVDITVSVGLAAAAVPNVMGNTRAAAEAALKAAKLTAGAVTEEGSAQPKGTVIRQTPASGAKLKPGDAVALVLSSGKTTIQVPKLRGLSESKALEKLREVGLKGRSSEIFHDSLPQGHVIRTRPAEGEEVEKGSAIKVYIVE